MSLIRYNKAINDVRNIKGFKVSGGGLIGFRTARDTIPFLLALDQRYDDLRWMAIPAIRFQSLDLPNLW